MTLIIVIIIVAVCAGAWALTRIGDLYDQAHEADTWRMDDNRLMRIAHNLAADRAKARAALGKKALTHPRSITIWRSEQTACRANARYAARPSLLDEQA
ncbi:MAG: hypothetical protein A3K04_02355 [Gallionellales bacterium RBG_16_56_9]|nr:MAG: hypothetical protein A3K04_02355 [Gallionellales bacterium RBG_16_56_9]